MDYEKTGDADSKEKNNLLGQTSMFKACFFSETLF